jgi:iron complex transport system substrate-binding protein
LRAGEPLYHLNSELIDRLQPDLLLTQEHCEVCAVTPGDVQRAGSGARAARQVALSAFSVADILQSIVRIAQALGLEQQGEIIRRQEEDRLEQVRSQAALSRRKSVVMIEWTDPLFAMGNWGPELVEIANGELLIGEKGQYSAAIAGEQLRDADPEYLIVAPCGFNLERSLRERSVLEQLPWWHNLRAVRESKVAFADGNLFFNRSGMTVSQTAEIIAEILHGATFGKKTEGVHWQRYEPCQRPTPVTAVHAG